MLLRISAIIICIHTNQFLFCYQLAFNVHYCTLVTITMLNSPFFPIDQLDSIRKTTFAQILCIANEGQEYVYEKSFLIPSSEYVDNLFINIDT